MRSDPGPLLDREEKVTVIMLMLFACAGSVDSDIDAEVDTGVDTDIEGVFCIDGRGYMHTPGAFWQCDNLCLTCTCTDDGEIILAPDGPMISTSECEEEPESAQFPKFPPIPK